MHKGLSRARNKLNIALGNAIHKIDKALHEFNRAVDIGKALTKAHD